MSLPVPPTSLKALEFPVAAETSIVTSTPSLAFKTALSAPAVLFCCVVLFAVKPFTFVALTVALELTISTSSSEPAPPRSVIISAPEVILKVSLPVPPVRLSVPAPPSRTSFPPLPSIISAPPDPVIMSPLSFPLRSKLPEPAFVIVIVLPSACALIIAVAALVVSLSASKLDDKLAVAVPPVTTKSSPVCKSVIVSDPAETVIVSSPLPPVIISSPTPPFRISAPPPELIISPPLPPVIVSAASPPVIVKASA